MIDVDGRAAAEAADAVAERADAARDRSGAMLARATALSYASTAAILRPARQSRADLSHGASA